MKASTVIGLIIYDHIELNVTTRYPLGRVRAGTYIKVCSGLILVWSLVLFGKVWKWNFDLVW